MTLIRSVVPAALCGLLLITPARGHEGHDHGDAPPVLTVQTAPRASASAPPFELVAVANGNMLTIYLDQFETNTPIIGATIDVETPAGAMQAQPSGDVYRLEADWIAAPGTHELLFTVADDSSIDFLPASLAIPAPAAPAAALAASGAFASLPGMVAAAQQGLRDLARRAGTAPAGPAAVAALLAAFVAGALLMALLRRRTAVVTIGGAVLILGLSASLAVAEAVPADTAIRDVAQRLPDGSVFAPKPAQRILAIRTLQAAQGQHRSAISMPGRIIPDPSASGLVQSATGGRLSAPEGGFLSIGSKVEAGQVLGYVLPIVGAADQTSQRQSRLELERQLTLQQRQTERLRSLAGKGTVSRAQLEEAELTLTGLRDQLVGLEDPNQNAEELLAPIAGIISKANALPGQIVDSASEIFHIIDPSRLRVEAMHFGDQPIADTASIRGRDGSKVSLTLLGAGLPENGRAQPIHFAVEMAEGVPGPGSVVTVFAETSSDAEGVAVPREAVVRGTNGQDMVYVHVAPEIFEPRLVRVAPLDAASVLIAAGVDSGERLVTQGAELLNQFR